MRPILCLTTSLIVLPGAFCARAEEHKGAASSPDIADAIAANAVSQVVIVANRAPQAIDKVGAAVTILTLPQIRARQTVVLSDLLASTPGVTMTRAGGVGETTALNIRGAPTDQTLTLIDGVKLDDPSTPGGGFSFSDLMTGDISRVEVLRGPQSTLYGSDAIGGVVNIVTADPTGAFQGDGQVEGGSYDTAYAKVGVGGKQGAMSWRLAANAYSTSGISAFNRARGGKEDDGYSHQGLTGRFGYAFTPDVSLDLRAVFVHARNRFDGFSTPTGAFGDDPEYGTTQETIAYAGLNFGLLESRLKNRVALQYTGTKRDNYDPTDNPVPKTFDGLGSNWRGEYQGLLALMPGWQAVFGAAHEQSRISVSTPAYSNPASPAYYGAPPIGASVHVDSGYGQLQAEVVRGLNLTGGLRYDNHSTFGGHGTGQASAAWSLNDGSTVLRASWGQGFKAPSLYQLYSQYGNLALNPQQSNGWDGGIQQRLWDGRIDLQATYFHRDTTNQIGFVDCVSLLGTQCKARAGGYYDNIAKARAQGVELAGVIRPLEGLSISANYTYTDASNRTPGKSTFGKLIARIPRDAANGEVSYAWPIRLTTTVSVRYAGETFDTASNSRRLKGYTLIDLRAAYPLTKTLEVYGRVENVADEAYETAYRYGSLGRAAYVGVRATF
jgi:vitamin B12 transporter